MESGELGAAVRRLREAADPAALGVGGGGRRVRGLRREELAELAGVSADYVRRLEQGRSHPSAGVVRALARALRVGRGEYERLCALAGYSPADGEVPRAAGDGALRLLERFGDAPAFLCDAAWGVVAVNRAWLAVAGRSPGGSALEWNVAWRTFRGGQDGIRRSDEETAGFQALLAMRLHSARMRYPADEPLAALVDGLRGGSRVFDALWRSPGRGVAYENRAVFAHPDGGTVALDGNLLAVPQDDLLAVVLTAAPGSADAGRVGELVAGSKNTPAVVWVGQVGPG